MGWCPETLSSEIKLMSHNYNTQSSVSTEHIRKKVKKDNDQHQILNSHYSYGQINVPTLERRHDLPLHKITGTLSSTSDTKQPSSSIDHYEQIFDYYSNNHESMSLDGILHFCNDLSIEPDSYEVLLFCFLCRAKQMYSLTKNEFLLGLKTLGNHINNAIDLRTLLFNYNISSYEEEFYLWTYQFGLIDGQRRLTTQNAISLWRLFYSKKIEKPIILDQWLSYLNNDINKGILKTIPHDIWRMFPLFATFIQLNGYELYNDNEAWPCLFDEFVEYYQKTIN